MPVFAVPSDTPFCIDASDAWILDQDTGGVLYALQRIRQAEAASATPERLRQLDAKIKRLNKTLRLRWGA